MELAHGYGTVLIIARQRDERRMLFNAFDGHFEAIYCARDIPQARTLLESVARVDVILLEFPADSRRAIEFCEEMSRDDGRACMPIVGLIDARLEPARLEPARLEPARLEPAGLHAAHRRPVASGVVEWITSPVDPLAALARVGAVLRTSVPSADAGSANHPAPPASLRPIAQTIDTTDLANTAAHPPGDRSGAQHRLLKLLAQLPRAGSGTHGFDAPLAVIAGAFGFDLALMIEPASGTRDELRRIGAYPPGDADSARDPLLRNLLDRVLSGAEIMLPDAGVSRPRAGADAQRFSRIIGLPLHDSHMACVGALLLARRNAGSIEADPREDLLAGVRVMAARFAIEMELHAAREHGRARGFEDALTGLPNRLLFNDRLAAILKEAHRSGEMFAVLFIDIDRFKNINDSLGHATGDQVLMATARRLRGGLRSSDILARYAGDEFTMILRHVAQREDVLRAAEKIVRMMEAPLVLGGDTQLHVTVSLGISFHPQDAVGAERLLKQADIAMYSAKRMGRNTFQSYVAEPEEAEQQRQALETKLHVAEKNGELRVYYQPQVDAGNEDIVGMEALIRWEHPDLGLISPGFFIPLAEASGLIMPIGEWVLRAACADARRWHQRFRLPLRLGVNLSPLQLRQPGLVKLVADVLAETGLDPALLDLEMTESMSMKSIPNLLETLHALRALGCSISIDDFGTGQSSLDYIRHLPADRIKIDQSFVRNIGVDPDDEAIVRATISMAHNLNRAVVAEGVETEEHLHFLRAQDCDVLQGYLFCQPLTAAAFGDLLAERALLRAGGTRAQASA